MKVKKFNHPNGLTYKATCPACKTSKHIEMFKDAQGKWFSACTQCSEKAQWIEVAA